MKTFLVTLGEKSQKKLEHTLLCQHVEHLKKLEKQGHLLVCGPYVDDSGAVLVLQAVSQGCIEELIQADPFIQEGYYGSYNIFEFYKADASNHYLMEHGQTIDELNKNA